MARAGAGGGAELGEVGAGLVVTVNGQRAAEVIGVAERIRRSGYDVRAAGTRRSDGKWLLKAPDGETRMIGIHRRRLLQALVESTDEVIRHDVWVLDRPLPRYTIGRTVLIGDAAHPMLPTLGQGANSALEDAVTLGLVIPAGADLAAGLGEYESLRYRRTQRIVRHSAWMGRTGGHLGACGQRLRNAVLRITPPQLALRNGTRIFEWTPPVSLGAQAVDRG